MKTIILAAGYATRLYPLTKDRPKPLLEVGGKPIIEHIINKIESVDAVDEIFIVTNNKFYSQFMDWADSFNSTKQIKVVNDQTNSNDDRLGSLGDIQFVIDNQRPDEEEDIMVVAGDNIFECDLSEVYDFFNKKGKTVVILYDVGDKALASHYGIVEIDNENKMVDFEEKPDQPKSTLASTGIYFYPKGIIGYLSTYLKEKSGDRAGDFLAWLYKKGDVYGYITREKWFDIGNMDQLEKARIFYR